MNPAPNLADPTVEPTDEQFLELLHRAGNDARAAREAAEVALRESVRVERDRRRAEFARSADAKP